MNNPVALVATRLLLSGALAVSLSTVIQGQTLGFTKILSSAQKMCLEQLLQKSWTPQFHKEMMKIAEVKTVILNIKGEPDYVYVFEADGWCGTAGCPLLIGEVQRNGACRLLYNDMGDKSFTVLRRRDHGYDRIYAPCEARFDGHQYQALHEDCPNVELYH